MTLLTEKGREVLIDAALRGHQQIRGSLHGRQGLKEGDCALGVMHRHYHQKIGTEEQYRWCFLPVKELVEAGYLVEQAGLIGCPDCGIRSLLHPVAHYNDEHGWDLLTIARKC